MIRYINKIKSQETHSANNNTNNSSSNNDSVAVNYTFNLPTILVIKILGYSIHDFELNHVLQLLLLSKHLHQRLKPIVMRYVSLNITSRSTKISSFHDPRTIYSIKSDYLTLVSLYEDPNTSTNLFTSLQHITIKDSFSFKNNNHLESLKKLVTNVLPVTSVDIIESEASTFDRVLYNIPHLQHLSIRETRTADKWLHYLSKNNDKLPSTLQSLALPSTYYLASFYFTTAPALKSLTLYDCNPLLRDSDKLPETIVNVHFIIPNNVPRNTDTLIVWLILNVSLQHIKLTNIYITSKLALLLRLPHLKSLTLVDRSGNPTSKFGVFDQFQHYIWYQEFYQSVRNAFIFGGVRTHIVIKDSRMDENRIRESEYLGGVYIQTFKSRDDRKTSKTTIILDGDYEWIEKNKERLQRIQFPQNVVSKILLSPNMSCGLLKRYSVLNRETLNYIRNTFILDTEVDMTNIDVELCNPYSIISNNNLKSITITVQKLEYFRLQINDNNNNNNVLFPNLKKMKLEGEDKVPMDILLTIPNLKKLIVVCEDEEENGKNHDVKTIDYNTDLGTQLQLHLEKKLNNINNINNQLGNHQHATLRKMILEGTKNRNHIISIPHYITHITIEDPSFVSSVGKAPNLTHLTIQSIIHIVKTITTKIIMKSLKHNQQFKQLESIKIIYSTNGNIEPLTIAKEIYSLVMELALLKPLKSLVFSRLKSAGLSLEDIQSIVNSDVNFVPFQVNLRTYDQPNYDFELEFTKDI